MLDAPAWAKNARRLGCRVDHLIGPGLGSNPFESIVAVRRVIGVHAILAFRPVAAAGVLVDRDKAVRDDVAPTTQDRAAEGLFGARQPRLGAIDLIAGIGRGDPVRRAMQDDRPAPSAALGQKHESVEPRAVAHRHHGLESASAGSIGELHRCTPSKKEPVVKPAL
jgi:hypothetical protein